MSANSRKKIAVSFLIVVTMLSGTGLLFAETNAHDYSLQQEGANDLSFSTIADFTPSAYTSQSVDPINSFPGQLVNLSYYLGTTSPSASYFEITVTLNYSSYDTLNAVPTLMTSLNPSGYYLLFSFETPNDEPGTWWNVGYQIVPVDISTIQTETTANLYAQGTQVWMKYPSVISGSDYMVPGGANFTFSTNVTGIRLFPENPQSSIIVSSQVNSWRFEAGTLKVNFSLYEYVGPSASTVPPFISAVVSYNTISSVVITGDPLSVVGPRLNLIQGNGAYLMGITSGQIAQITNAVNQSLSIPISQLNAAVVSINGDTASINTNFGTMIVLLKNINATINSVKDGQVTVTSDLGTITTSLSSLNATITSVNLGIIEIGSSLGDITTSITSINSSLKAINGTMATIQTEIGTIITSLNSINATISSIDHGMAIVNTSIGRINTSLKSLNSTIITLSGDTATLTTSVGEINASLNSLNTSIFSSSAGIPWLNLTYASIETCLGNISGTIINVSNNTATIETSLGAVTTSVEDIKAGTARDPASFGPFTLYDLIVISLLAVLLIVAALAMLNSRNTLKIIGDKDR
jgi:methyl-accepting chemotaxis protein